MKKEEVGKYNIEVIRMSDEKKEQRKQEPPQSVLAKALTVGFVSGILWSALGALSYYFHFSEVSAASFIFRSFWQTSWTSSFLAEVLAVIIVGLLSVLVSFIYYISFKRINGIWPGMIFGTVLFAAVFLGLNPIFSAVPSWNELSGDSYVTNICLYILYGVFIGYSISYEFHEYNQQTAE
ncbi:YqhR family membrane protein [Halobacillus sp. A5]|uniref:YqhR family membrane protein n=1 Tax=Halobacillus sp. A5 TaxID=2880263 RepID=UPI0020A6AC7B|nr:YqhR family membrane protein [Halobacillus sp. A5]MCP3025713.1 YqhR family membrane protein [Halobacillus sp. A5]